VSSNKYPYQIFKIETVSKIIDLSRSTIYELINPKSKYYDPSFPKPLHLTQNRIGWISQEIYDWLELKIAQREK